MVSRRFMPPDSGSTWLVARSSSWTNSSSWSARSADLAAATARSSGRRPTRFSQHRELDVEGVLLRHDAEPGPDPRRRRPPGRARAPAASPSVTGETQPIIRIVDDLPAPLGPRKPNASPRRDLDVDAVDGGEVAEALHQAAGQDHRVPRARWSTLDRPTDRPRPDLSPQRPRCRRQHWGHGRRTRTPRRQRRHAAGERTLRRAAATGRARGHGRGASTRAPRRTSPRATPTATSPDRWGLGIARQLTRRPDICRCRQRGWPGDDGPAMTTFSAATQAWFDASFSAPTAAQAGRLGRRSARAATPWSSPPPARARRWPRSSGRSTGWPASRAPGRAAAPLPGALRLAAEGARRRRRAQPARPADRHPARRRPARPARARHHRRRPVRRHPGRRAPPVRCARRPTS